MRGRVVGENGKFTFQKGQERQGKKGQGEGEGAQRARCQYCNFPLLLARVSIDR